MQINVVCKEDTKAIAEKITACNYELEKTTEKSKGREKEFHGLFFPWTCSKK